MATYNAIALTVPDGTEDQVLELAEASGDTYRLKNVIGAAGQYTFSVWARADEPTTVTFCVLGAVFTGEVSTDWKRYVHTVQQSETTYIDICPGSDNPLYLYKAQLETGNVATDWHPAPEDVDQNISNQIDAVRETIVEQSTSLLNTAEQIVFDAVSSYTEKTDFESFREMAESQFEQLANEITLKFTQTTEQITNVNGDLQDQINTITKYFTFDINGLTIGQANNPYKVIIDNDRYSMTVNGVEVMWIADGEVHTPELTVTDRFKLFGYQLELDSSGNLNCEYVGA